MKFSYKDSINEIELIDIFADNLRDIMFEKNISQAELSRLSRVSSTSISNYLNKRKLIGLPALMNICQVLECSITELLPYDGEIFIRKF